MCLGITPDKASKSPPKPTRRNAQLKGNSRSARGIAIVVSTVTHRRHGCMRDHPRAWALLAPPGALCDGLHGSVGVGAHELRHVRIPREFVIRLVTVAPPPGRARHGSGASQRRGGAMPEPPGLLLQCTYTCAPPRACQHRNHHLNSPTGSTNHAVQVMFSGHVRPKHAEAAITHKLQRARRGGCGVALRGFGAIPGDVLNHRR